MISLSGPGAIERILWLHRTDRWYFGDFLRHSAWLQWLLDAFPGASIDLASRPAYLMVYDDERFTGLHDSTRLDRRLLAAYDLVVEPAAQPPPPPGRDVPLVLASWDTGWTLYRKGIPVLSGTKSELNYFRAAHPSTIIGPRGTGTTPARFHESENRRSTACLETLFPEAGPVLIYNPTASNPYTRGTQLPKEVDNCLNADEHAVIVRRLLDLLPDHFILVGASVKPGDTANAEMIRSVAHRARSSRVVPLLSAGSRGPKIREFMTLLANDRICSSIGSGTGTNTHLAALTGTCSLSIERGADAAMLANWAQPNTFQMGSFRWRNPHPTTAIHTLRWEDRSRPKLNAVADAFGCHHDLLHHPPNLLADAGEAHPILTSISRSWTRDPVHDLPLAKDLIENLTAAAKLHYANFDDECAYLAVRHGLTTRTGVDTLIAALDQPENPLHRITLQLFEDSNLHKLGNRIADRCADEATTAMTSMID